jgi:hypothetical protein
MLLYTFIHISLKERSTNTKRLNQLNEDDNSIWFFTNLYFMPPVHSVFAPSRLPNPRIAPLLTSPFTRTDWPTRSQGCYTPGYNYLYGPPAPGNKINPPLTAATGWWRLSEEMGRARAACHRDTIEKDGLSLHFDILCQILLWLRVVHFSKKQVQSNVDAT